MKIHFDPLVSETFNRISSARALLKALEAGLPEAEKQEIESLKAYASRNGWDKDTFFSELNVLKWTYEHWIPRFAEYGVIALLHSIVETQLRELCRRLREHHHYKLRFGDLAGSAIEKAKVYLTKVADLPITCDPDWGELQDLKHLREIIVHGLGKSGEKKGRVEALMSRHPGKISWFNASFDPETEIIVSTKLCEHYVDVVENFFKRLYNEAGLPAKGIWTEP